MAKRDKAASWQEPEFDEVKFMRTEMRAARATIAVVLWTLPAAALSYGLTLAGVAVVAFFTGIGMLFLLKWVLPILKVDTSEYKRKDWIGHGLTFFFSWLAFWILLLNPPFADLTSPTIYGVTVDGNPVSCGDLYSALGSMAALNVTAGDNVGVVSVTVDPGSGPVAMTHAGGTLWTKIVSVPANNALIVASDGVGHTASCRVTIM